MATKLKIPGAHRVIKRSSCGAVTIYWYRYRGGPQLMRFHGHDLRAAELAEQQGYDQLLAAHVAGRTLQPVAEGNMSALVKQFRAAPDGFLKLAPSTQKEWGRWLRRIDEDFGSLSYKALGDRRMKLAILKWRDGFSSQPRKADYGVQVMRRLLSFGVERLLLDQNAALGIRSIYSFNRADQVISDDEFAAILANATPCAALAFRLAAATGMRRGDLVDLCWSDVRANRIDKPTNKSRGRTHILAPLRGDGLKVIEELREFREAMKAKGKVVSDHVLLTARGAPWQPNSLTEAFEKAASAAGVDKRLHDLRGTAATRMKRQGFSNELIARCIGWEESKVNAIIGRYVDLDAIARDQLDQVEAEAEKV